MQRQARERSADLDRAECDVTFTAEHFEAQCKRSASSSANYVRISAKTASVAFKRDPTGAFWSFPKNTGEKDLAVDRRDDGPTRRRTDQAEKATLGRRRGATIDDKWTTLTMKWVQRDTLNALVLDVFRSRPSCRRGRRAPSKAQPKPAGRRPSRRRPKLRTTRRTRGPENLERRGRDELHFCDALLSLAALP